jgi:hypothetical protein
MFSEENPLIKRTIEVLQFFRKKLNTHPQLRAWLWFILLWFVGLFGTLILAYGTKGVFWLSKAILG